MTINELLRTLNAGAGSTPESLRFSALLTGAHSALLFVSPYSHGTEESTTRSALASVSTKEDEQVRYILVRAECPVRVLRHIERTVPEVQVK